jgi:outer membrane cobalamin receptor
MKTFSKFIIFVSLFSTFQFSFFASLSADKKTASLEEIVVTATRIEELKKDVSASVQIITQENIKNSTAKNVNLKGSYRPIKNLEITASIENLLDGCK